MDAIAELSRRVDNLLRFGLVAEIDYATARVRVKTGNLLTTWIPWVAACAGKRINWAPPSIGEQVLLLSPTGELTAAVALAGLYHAIFLPPESNSELTVQQFEDGAVIEYDHSRHELKVTLPEDGTAIIEAPGGVTLKVDGGLTIEGDTEIQGELKVTGDRVTHNDVDIGATHQHPGVKSGSSITGPPVPAS